MRIAGRVHKNFARRSGRPAFDVLSAPPSNCRSAARFRAPPADGSPALRCDVVFSIRAASPGCGVMTRMAFFGQRCAARASPARSRPRPPAIPSRATAAGSAAFICIRQIRRGQAGADQNGAGRFRQFDFRLPHVHHDGLQLRRDGVINIFLREQRDEAGLRALRRRARPGPPRRESRNCPRQSPDARTSLCGRRHRGAAENRRNRPATSSSIRRRCGQGIKPTSSATSSRPTNGQALCCEHADFRRADGQRDRRFNRRALRLRRCPRSSRTARPRPEPEFLIR